MIKSKREALFGAEWSLFSGMHASFSTGFQVPLT